MKSVPLPVKVLILLHMFMSLAGLLIHANLHPVTESLFFLWASPLNAVSLIIIPVLLARPSTVSWGYLFNALIVLIGTVAMTYFSLMNIARPITLSRVLIESTLPPILILWCKLILAHHILKRMLPLRIAKKTEGCKQ